MVTMEICRGVNGCYGDRSRCPWKRLSYVSVLMVTMETLLRINSYDADV